MVLLELADISLPTKVSIVNERNGCISLIVGLVRTVGVEPRLGLAGHVDFCLDLKVVLFNRFSLDSVLLSDDG